MASVEKRGKKFIVRWRDPDGSQHTRSCPDLETARTLRREVERTVALGHAWRPDDTRAAPALVERNADGIVQGLFPDFLEHRRGRLSAATRGHYNRSMLQFARWLNGRHPTKRRLTVELLTRDNLEAWFATLVDERLGKAALAVSTATLKVQALRSCWQWAEDSDTYAEWVGRARRLDLPAPVFTPAAAPTWAQMDAAIAASYQLAREGRTSHERAAWVWRARVMILLRFTGLRVDEQVMRLEWPDVLPLEAETLVLRGELGKSRQERSGRLLPLSPRLVEVLAGWGQREGFLVAPHLRSWRRPRRATEPEVLQVARRRSDPQAIAQVWALARVPDGTDNGQAVPSRVYAAGTGRRKGQPHHAFRKGFKTGLAGLGVAQDVRDFLVGHHRGIDETYIETFEHARAAVKLIPALADQVLEAIAELDRDIKPSKVVQFRR